MIDTIDATESFRAYPDRQALDIFTHAAVARCRSLLETALVLDRNDRANAVGQPLRALVEALYVGIICALGNQHDLERLESDNRYWRADLAEKIDEEPDEGPRQKFSTWQQAKRVDELMAATGGIQDLGTACFNYIYAGESFQSTHTKLGTLQQHISRDPNGRLVFVAEPQPEDQFRYWRLRLAAMLTATLAKLAWHRSGLDPAAFDGLDQLEL